MLRIPVAIRRLKWRVVRTYKKVVWFGLSRYCPVCRSHIHTFLPGGDPPRAGALCPICEAAERHRLIWFVIQSRGLLSRTSAGCSGIRILHVAPEHCIRASVERLKHVDYWTSSLEGHHTRIALDITSMSLECFDGIRCSHVLEHVVEDRVAMGEFYRVLKPGGWAILQVPIELNRMTTYEDLTIVTTEARKAVFGQEDHVRIYGTDYIGRLCDAGFDVGVIHGQPFVGNDAIRFGFDASEPLFLCRKLKDCGIDA
jgi:SAM-dependent methyltransferase